MTSTRSSSTADPAFLDVALSNPQGSAGRRPLVSVSFASNYAPADLKAAATTRHNRDPRLCACAPSMRREPCRAALTARPAVAPRKGRLTERNRLEVGRPTPGSRPRTWVCGGLICGKSLVRRRSITYQRRTMRRRLPLTLDAGNGRSSRRSDAAGPTSFPRCATAVAEAQAKAARDTP